MKLLVIITRMYKLKNGNELKKWGCRENGVKEKDIFLFIDGYKKQNSEDDTLFFQEQIENNNKINEVIYFILEEIKKKLETNLDYKEVGIIFHPNPDESIEDDDPILNKWANFVIKFKEIERIEFNKTSIEVVFIDKYSSKDTGIYSEIKKLCIKEVSKEVIENIWYYFSFKEKIKSLNIRKQDLNYIFLPLDIELSGLQQTHFNKNYLGEIKDYHQESAINLKKELLNIVFDKKSGRSIKSIQDDICKRIEPVKHKNEVKKLWEEIKKELPSAKRKVWPKNLDINKLKIDALGKAKNQSKEYRDWYSNFNESIDNLEKKVIEVSDSFFR